MPTNAELIDPARAPLIGVIGGIAPESTIAYYRLLIAGLRSRLGGAYPRLVINSIDLTQLLRLANSGDREALAEFLTGEVERLAQAGCKIGFFASNTPHLVFDAVAAASPIPLVSIVEAAVAETAARGFKRVGLLGTRVTMEAPFYPAVFAQQGIEVYPPKGADSEYAQRIYATELVEGIFRPESREGLLGVIHRLVSHHQVEAVILGGTELPLILGNDSGSPVPLLDTAAIHVDAVITRLAQLS